jgi:hypothetical protein
MQTRLDGDYNIRHKKVVGAVANGKLGIGSIETPRWHKAYKKES